MQSIINRSFLIIWLPSVVMTILIILLSIVGINFVHKIFDFIVGNPYDISSVLIGLTWLFSMSWTLLAFLNRNTFRNDMLDRPESHGNLYKITSIRVCFGILFGQSVEKNRNEGNSQHGFRTFYGFLYISK